MALKHDHNRGSGIGSRILVHVAIHEFIAGIVGGIAGQPGKDSHNVEIPMVLDVVGVIKIGLLGPQADIRPYRDKLVSVGVIDGTAGDGELLGDRGCLQDDK